MRKLLYYLWWFARCRIHGDRIPLTCSIILTDRCNLACRHCVVSNLGYRDLTFQQVMRDLETLHRLGARVLVITGGEPFLWTDDRHAVEDVVLGARHLGFFRIVVCTNGTLGLTSSADYLWVSLDGLPAEHNRMRGEVYDRVVSQIARSRHPRININFTISKENADQLPDSAEHMLHIPNVRGILFHLFTPYLGADKDLALDADQRKTALDTLRRLKRRHPLKLINTFDGIRLLRNDRWERPVWSSIVVNDGQVSPCCCRAGIADKDVCRNCGCSPAVETFALQTAKPLAALEWLRFL